MIRPNNITVLFFLGVALILASVGPGLAGQGGKDTSGVPLTELSPPAATTLENLVLRASPRGPVLGYATHYAKRFEGRRTSSGHRYNPEKMTAAHHSLPLGTVVRVVNPATKQEVHVTVNDRCARKSFHFIDLSLAAAKKIGLWRKGTIKVVIIPLLEEPV